MAFSRPDSEAVMQLTSSNVTLMVGDMDRSIAFYECIGLKLKQRWNNHYAMLEGPGITLGIHPGGDDRSSSGTVSIGFMVSDTGEAKALLERLGIEYRDSAGEQSGNFCHFEDPDGTALYFVKPLRQA
jgi:catechol 2,3-dioxygenase-like lactoylglutathione lyase family enzyme